MNNILVLFLLVIATEGAPEGDYCSKDGLAGVCTNIRVCPAAQQDIRNRKKPQLCEFLDADPIVCCVTNPLPVLTTIKPSTTTVDIPRDYDYFSGGSSVEETCDPIPASLTAPKTGQKAFDKCIDYQEKAVYPCDKSAALHGKLSRSNRCHHSAEELATSTTATANEFPHTVLLGYGDRPTSLWWLCSGALISEKFVLTAGHCTSHRDVGAVSYAQLGSPRLSSIPSRNRRSRIPVKNIIKHPQYSPPVEYHDIALLELGRAVPVDEFSVPACLHTGAPVADSRALLAGWGLAAYNRNASDDLQKMQLRKLEASECAAAYRPTRLMRAGFDESTQLCYGPRDTDANICQVDGGSPLIIMSNKIACMYTIIGVASSGAACHVREPGLYTRVAPYRDWIERTVWPAA